MRRERWSRRAAVALAALGGAVLAGCGLLEGVGTAEQLASQGDICGLPGLPPTLSLNLLFATGLLTGLSHCAGMCGPLVGAFAAQRRQQGGGLTSPLLLYQLGRVGTYVLLGLAAGGFGAATRALVVSRGWQGRMSVLAGLLVLAMGLALLTGLPGGGPGLLRPLTGRVSLALRRLIGHPHPAAPVAMGLFNGLLPCGAVYAMLGLAATSGQPLRGAGVMLAFGLGTLPAMLGMGFFASALGLRLRGRLYRLAALLVMALGLQLVLRGLAAAGFVEHLHVAGVMLW